MGMVTTPVVATLAAPLPVMVPMSELATTATLAGPPTMLPVRVVARLLKSMAPPVCNSTAPKMTNRAISVADTPRGMPKMPPRDR